MIYEILLLEDFKWNDFSGSLYFSRYKDNNPGIVLKTQNGKIILDCTKNNPVFFDDHPFGDHKIVIINQDDFTEGILQALIDQGIVESPLFYLDDVVGNKFPVCEITETVIDLLKAYGEYYV